MVCKYAEGMRAQAEKSGEVDKVQLAMLKDICTMLGIAQGVMEPSQPEAGNDNKQKEDETK